MQISFIITTFNISSYIEQCIQSLADCLESGDQVIIVDDGSTDGTIERIDAATAAIGVPDVEIRKIYLGVNTIGGVGIAGNIGMAAADRAVTFFVDGDDFIEKEGFLKGRRRFAKSDDDILFCNYLEHDEKNNAKKFPADQAKWAGLKNVRPEERLNKALNLIAVPWRKFYRTDFLKKHQLRFPEGDFFFEDNPFHWEVCRKADGIDFLDTVICHHRVNRPGQTMTSTGGELSAFFTHFETIMSGIPPEEVAQRELACRWLVNNMTWHLDRLKQEAVWSYLRKASAAMNRIPDEIWDGSLQNFFETKSIWPIVCQLRDRDLWSVYQEMVAKHRYVELRRLLKQVNDSARLAGEDAKKARELAQARQYIDEYEAHLRLPSRIDQ